MGIYPIKQRHLDQFNAQMRRSTANFGADVSNFRVIQPTGDRVVAQIYEPGKRAGGERQGPMGGGGGSGAGVAVLVIILVLLLAGMTVCAMRGNLLWNSSPQPAAPKQQPKETEFTDPKKIEEKKEEPANE